MKLCVKKISRLKVATLTLSILFVAYLTVVVFLKTNTVIINPANIFIYKVSVWITNTYLIVIAMAILALLVLIITCILVKNKSMLFSKHKHFQSNDKENFLLDDVIIYNNVKGTNCGKEDEMSDKLTDNGIIKTETITITGRVKADDIIRHYRDSKVKETEKQTSQQQNEDEDLILLSTLYYDDLTDK